MLDSIVASPIVVTMICALLAALVVSPAYLPRYLGRGPVRAAIPARFPLKSFSRAALIAFLVLINAVSLGMAHRLPLGSTLVALGFLMLLFLPADEPYDGPATHA